jgi:hypothetical protein
MQQQLDFTLAITKAVRREYIPTSEVKAKSCAEVMGYLFTVKDATNREIARHLHKEICCITPRVYELREGGRVVLSGTRVCDVTGNRVTAWRRA